MKSKAPIILCSPDACPPFAPRKILSTSDWLVLQKLGLLLRLLERLLDFRLFLLLKLLRAGLEEDERALLFLSELSLCTETAFPFSWSEGLLLGEEASLALAAAGLTQFDFAASNEGLDAAIAPDSSAEPSAKSIDDSMPAPRARARVRCMGRQSSSLTGERSFSTRNA